MLTCLHYMSHLHGLHQCSEYRSTRIAIGRWDARVPWHVPRTLSWSPPPGMYWVAPGQLHRLGPQVGAQVISADDWTADVATLVQAVLLVSAVRACALVLGGIPADHLLYSRRPVLLHLNRHQRISVTARESRTGELWAFPLTSSHAL